MSSSVDKSPARHSTRLATTSTASPLSPTKMAKRANAAHAKSDTPTPKRQRLPSADDRQSLALQVGVRKSPRLAKRIELRETRTRRLYFFEVRGSALDCSTFMSSNKAVEQVNERLQADAIYTAAVARHKALTGYDKRVPALPCPSPSAVVPEPHREVAETPPVDSVTTQVDQIKTEPSSVNDADAAAAASSSIAVDHPPTPSSVPLPNATPPKFELGVVTSSSSLPPSGRSSLDLRHQQPPEPTPSPVVSEEGSVERAAKQEAAVVHRIAELRREGKWSAKRLPICADPPRAKTHWDYLLEEMRWMQVDFTQELRFKRVAAKKLACAVVKSLRERDEEAERAERERTREGRRACAAVARAVRDFWKDVRRAVDYKRDGIIEAKKRRALDQHLDFIVGQTERFSTMVQQGLQQPLTAVEAQPATPSTSVTPDVLDDTAEDDDDFSSASSSSEDDESTIERDEAAMDNDEVSEEVSRLQHECEMQEDDFLDSLPPEYVAQLLARKPSGDAPSVGDDRSSCSEEEEDNASNATPSRDSSRPSSSSRSSKTPVEEPAAAPPPAAPTDEPVKTASSDSLARQDELTHIAEEAERFRPKGYTLDTAQVVTEVPFLLKHKLREYQHVGLDWLVALHHKNLNGILADEMGLGKTIQTIALLAYLACVHGDWGPHLVVVPTSVLLNWEMELKKWCPAFKVLTYFGQQKERRAKRRGWLTDNTFHVCVTSYKLVTTDIRVFKQKRWQYLVLDEAQNIKNFKSQRWQLLLRFNAKHRLLLTGTPLQNNLMELWSLMHFLMPHVFASHRDFGDWFGRPLTGMIEGVTEYDQQIVQRLHKVLRPFLLRRLKAQVEKQLPKKYEHVIKCSLSKRQRFLYDDFMSKGTTKDQLSSGNVMSVLNVLMQLRKCCNHPNLFEPRPTVSPFVVDSLRFKYPAAVFDLVTDNKPAATVDLFKLGYTRHSLLRQRQLACDRRRIHEVADESEMARRPKLPSVNGLTWQYDDRFKINHTTPVVDQSSSNRSLFCVPEGSLPPRTNPVPAWIQVGGSARQIPVSLLLKTQPTSQQESGIQQEPPTHSVPLIQQQRVPISLSLDQRMTTPEMTTLRRVDDVTALASNTQMNVGGGSVVTTATAPRPVAAQSRVVVTASLKLPTAVADGTAPTAPRPTVKRSHEDEGGAPFDGSWWKPTANGSNSVGRRAVSGGESPAVKRQKLAAVDLETEQRVQCVARLLKEANKKDAYFEDSIGRRRAVNEVGRLERLATVNERRCHDVYQMYSSDLIDLLSHCISGARTMPSFARQSIETFFDSIDALIDRFLMAIASACVNDSPRVEASGGGRVAGYAQLEHFYRRALADRLRSRFTPLLARIANAHRISFPELRLIEYDCGKLQALSSLLRQLKADNHRCLVFTQMAKMLDILEAFLSYHGYKYLRLDGTTKIEHRQFLMERFNTDARIFCFILSTRSGGIGVNLTGADTVVFYDSDWNPTMDAQAQDRCHRIGQTRDVHIYRLISERTVEENILKKASDKRKLGEVAIEEGKFTVDFFKQDKLSELFDIAATDLPVASASEPVSQQDVEQAMLSTEDSEDATAAKRVRAEVAAEYVEFDEDASNAAAAGAELNAELAGVEDQFSQILNQMRPIERYAFKFLETLNRPDFEDEMKQTDKDIAQQKVDWTKAQEEAMRRREEQLQQHQDDAEEDDDLTYAVDDGETFYLLDSNNSMPMWLPPSPPPSGDEDATAYRDPVLDFWYAAEPMAEADLPPVEHASPPPAPKTVVPTLAATASVPAARPLPPQQTTPTPVRQSSSSAIINALSSTTPFIVNAAAAVTRASVDETIDSVCRSNQKAIAMQTAAAAAASAATMIVIDQQQRQQSASPNAAGAASSIGKQTDVVAPTTSAATGPPPSSVAAVGHSSYVPRSLFDSGPSKKEKKPLDAHRAMTPPPPVFEDEHYDGPEWTVIEDITLLQAITKQQRMSYNLHTTHLGHTPNWDFVADWVNMFSSHYRSGRQCSLRYQLVVLPREEGRLVAFDPITKKPRKIPLSNQELANVKKGRLRTNDQFQHDGQLLMNTRTMHRFKAIKQATAKYALLRQRPNRNPLMPMSVASIGGGKLSSDHDTVLAGHGINYRAASSWTPQRMSEYRADRMKERAEKLRHEKLKQEQAERLRKLQQERIEAEQSAVLEQQQQQQQQRLAAGTQQQQMQQQYQQQQQMYPGGGTASTSDIGYGSRGMPPPAGAEQEAMHQQTDTQQQRYGTVVQRTVQSAVPSSYVYVSQAAASGGTGAYGVQTATRTAVVPSATGYRTIAPQQHMKGQRTPPGTPSASSTSSYAYHHSASASSRPQQTYYTSTDAAAGTGADGLAAPPAHSRRHPPAPPTASFSAGGTTMHDIRPKHIYAQGVLTGASGSGTSPRFVLATTSGPSDQSRQVYVNPAHLPTIAVQPRSGSNIPVRPISTAAGRKQPLPKISTLSHLQGGSGSGGISFIQQKPIVVTQQQTAVNRPTSQYRTAGLGGTAVVRQQQAASSSSATAPSSSTTSTNVIPSISILVPSKAPPLLQAQRPSADDAAALPSIQLGRLRPSAGQPPPTSSAHPPDQHNY